LVSSARREETRAEFSTRDWRQRGICISYIHKVTVARTVKRGAPEFSQGKSRATFGEEKLGLGPPRKGRSRVEGQGRPKGKRRYTRKIPVHKKGNRGGAKGENLGRT